MTILSNSSSQKSIYSSHFSFLVGLARKHLRLTDCLSTNLKQETVISKVWPMIDLFDHPHEYTNLFKHMIVSLSFAQHMITTAICHVVLFVFSNLTTGMILPYLIVGFLIFVTAGRMGIFYRALNVI